MYKDYGFNSTNWSAIHEYVMQPILRRLSARPGRTILDLGCGNGWLATHLLDRGFNVYGLDASPTGIDIARRQHPDRFFLQDLGQGELPPALRDIPFDTILSTEVIEHLYAPRAFLDFCKYVLLPRGGGELILSTPYHGYLKNLALSVSGRMDRHFTALWDGGHIKFWSRKTLTSLLEEEGFREVTFTGCGRVTYLWKSMVLSAHI
jgi:2-polyprenyl-3-methyl-5-hydroxy-6-metoxy-1,4-benzoquinol methylase